MSRPRHLFSVWPELREHFADPRKAALLTDFDGTLAPIRRRPGAVRLSARRRRLLARLALTCGTFGVVSGRGLDDLRARIAIPGIWYVGAHGYVLRDPAGRRRECLTAAGRARMARARRRLARRVGKLEGIALEFKGATLAVHYRNATARSRKLAQRAVEEMLGADPRLRLQSGKKVWELLPDGCVDKWTAVRYILARERRRGAARVAVYLGDDATDEAVFRGLRGITVAVGKKSKTSARFYLRSPAEVWQFVKRLEEERKCSRR